MIHYSIARVLHPLSPQALCFHDELLKVQQLSLLHVLLSLDFVPLQIHLILCNSFRKNSRLVWPVAVLEADSPQQAGTVLNEGDGQTQPNEAYLLELGRLLNIQGFLAEGETVRIVLYEVGHDEGALQAYF
jgi:hypothetical protein